MGLTNITGQHYHHRRNLAIFGQGQTVQLLREAVKIKKSVFLLLCLLTFCLINIYSEPKFTLGMVWPGTVLNPSPPRVSRTFTLSDVRILMASLRDQYQLLIKGGKEECYWGCEIAIVENFPGVVR